MKIINFKAKYIAPAFVQKKQNNEYKSKEVSFVEFSENSGMDFDTIETLSNTWKYSFVPDIYKSYMFNSNKNKHLYGIVDQQSDYEKIKPENVLGLLFFDEKNKNNSEIEYFQVNPQYKFKEDENFYPDYLKNKRERTYKEVGQELLNAIKAKYATYLIEVVPTLNAEEFYLQQGFEYDDKFQLQMHWKNKSLSEQNLTKELC